MYETQQQFAIPTSIPASLETPRAIKADGPNPYAQPLRLIHSGNLKRGCRILAALCNLDKLAVRVPGVVEMYHPAGVAEAVKAYSRLKMLGDLGFGAETITITPALAQIMLRHNFSNRNIVPANLEAYIASVGAGGWSKNGETVILATDGSLNDGQHRLLASLITNEPFKTAISFGVEKDTMMTVDTGRARRPGDRLSMLGIESPHHVAAVYGLAYEMLYGSKALPDQGREFYAAHSARLLEAFELGKASRAYPMPASWNVTAFSAAAFFLLQGGAAFGKIEEFMTRFKTGENLHAGHPILTLRNGLSGREKIARARLVMTVMAHYNLHRLGKKARGLVAQTTIPAVEVV